MALERKTASMVVATVVVLMLGACARSSIPQASNLVTEADFVADPALRLQPGQVGLTFLEAPGALPDGWPDTGGSGVDIIPFVVHEGESRTFGLDPEDATGTIAMVEIKDGGGTVLATLRWPRLCTTCDPQNPGGPSATLYLPPGEYGFHIHGLPGRSSGQSAPRMVFYHRPGNGGQGGTSGWRSPRASQTDEQTLITTGSCRGCDLSGACLNASEAVVEPYDFTGGNFSGANFSAADIERVMFDFADLAGANFSGATLRDVDFGDANLQGANFSGASWVGDLVFTGADLSGATWFDGKKVCAQGSIGTCN